MNVKTAPTTAAAAGIAVVAGTVVYRLAKNNIMLRLEERKTRKLEATVSLLNQQLEANPHVITVRFEAA